MRAPRRSTAAVLASLLAGAALVGAELVSGALDVGEVPPPRPCTERTPLGGDSLDAKLQRIALDGLSRAACRLGTTRTRLALALDSAEERRRIAGGRDLNEVLRESLLQAVDEHVESGRLGGFEAFLARQLIGRTPVSWLQRLLELG